MCKLVTVHVLPLWLSFSAQCNLSLSEWGILLLSFMIIVLIYLHNILMLQDVASPVVVFVMLCHISMWRLLSYYGPRVPGAVALLNRTNITTDIETSASWPNLIVTILSHFKYFSFPSVNFCFAYHKEVRHWADCPNPLHVSIVTSVEPSLSQNWVELHSQSAR